MTQNPHTSGYKQYCTVNGRVVTPVIRQASTGSKEYREPVIGSPIKFRTKREAEAFAQLFGVRKEPA